MGWLDVTLVVLFVWIAINVAIVAALVSATRRPAERAPGRPVLPPDYRGPHLVRPRPRSARTPT